MFGTVKYFDTSAFSVNTECRNFKIRFGSNIKSWFKKIDLPLLKIVVSVFFPSKSSFLAFKNSVLQDVFICNCLIFFCEVIFGR